MKKLLKSISIIIVLLVIFVAYQYRSLLIKPSKKDSLQVAITTNNATIYKLINHSTILKDYTRKYYYNSKLCFLIDMSLPCGKNRFFVYDLQHDSVITSGLVAHGSGNTPFTSKAEFSNKISSGLTALGKYKVDYQYPGRFGAAYKLKGLDSSNSNAFKRNIVLHAYGCVPDNEPYPLPICNSLGCTMVSYSFIKKLGLIISKSQKPIVMWVYN